MQNTPIRFGLIGYGLFGAHHARAIHATAGAVLSAVAVPSASSRHAARTAYPHADIHEDYRQLLDRSSVDVVDIVVPNHLHYEIALAALDAGKHVLLEKPMALSVAHCDKLLSAGRKQNCLIAVNHELRHSSLWGQAKRLVDDGVIGAPLHALVELSRFPYRRGSQGWRWDIARVGNWILEEPIHFFDLARWYLAARGEPVSVYARANSRHSDHPELCDNFSAIVNFQNGAYALVSQTLAAFEHHVTAKIAGTEGTIWAHWSGPDARSDRPTYRLRYGLGDDLHEVDVQKPAGELVELADQIAMMTRCIGEHRQPLCTGQDGRWSTLLCLAAQRSIDKGRVVTTDEVAG